MFKYNITHNDKLILTDLVSSPITVSEDINDIALEISFTLAIIPNMPRINIGDDIKVSGIPYGEGTARILFQGVVWRAQSDSSARELSITVFERTKYLAESEEAFQLPVNTASDRLRTYATAWGIPVGDIPSTGVRLAAERRRSNVMSSIKKDLTETVQKGGDAYKVRIRSGKIDLYRLGTNPIIYRLEGTNTTLIQMRTMEGMVTQVKVIDSSRSQTVSYTDTKGRKRKKKQKFKATGGTVFRGPIEKYGVLQKVIEVSQADDMPKAISEAKGMIDEVEKETFTVYGIGVNTIRVGDRVRLENMPYDVYVTNVQHSLGNVDTMRLVCGTLGYIKREYYF